MRRTATVMMDTMVISPLDTPVVDEESPPVVDPEFVVDVVTES